MSPTKDDLGTISRTPKDDFAEEGVVIREVEEGTRCEQCNNICAGFSPHEWRKTCQSCKCPREAHAIYQEQVTSVRERLGLKAESQTSRIEPRQLGYTWVPPGIMTSAKVQRYFDKIPPEKVPKVGTSGERYRERQITLQLPKQDLALDHCKHIESQHRASYEDFVAARNEIALDIGYIKDAPQSTKCVNCDDRIAKGDLAVIAPKFRDQMMWHPKCFSCATCDELLVDLTYCVHEEKIYCERHYAELLKPRCNACDEAKKSSEKDVEKVSTPQSQNDAGLQDILIEQETSAGTEETVACGETDENAHHNVGLRRSPRIDDIGRYEERLCEEDAQAKVLVMLPSAQPCDNKLESPLLTEPGTHESRTGSKNLSPSPIKEPMRNESPSKFGGETQTPVIEVIRVGSPTGGNSKEPGSLLEGISDFYDFNASINPSRSPSRERSLRKSISPTRSKSPSRKLVEEKDKTEVPFDTNDLSGLSGFYDFCVMINQHAYGHNFQRAHSAHRSSTDYLEAKLKARKSKSKSPSHFLSAPKNGVASLPETGGGKPNPENLLTPQDTANVLNLEYYKRSPSPLDSPSISCGTKNYDNTTTSPLDNPLTPVSLKHLNSRGDPFYTASTPLETPETPEFQRSFSANMRYLEQMKDEYRTNAFKRSTYIGESMDFENDFEELRERTRHFKRSRSRSRSPLLEDVMDPCTSKQAAQRELQDKILEEITKTTIHYQDFSRDMSQRFVDYDRRGSDSALLQKESIPIEDSLRERALQSDEDLLNELEGEEYHHFRRYSLNLENQEDDYSDDTSYVFLEEINVQIASGTRNWTRKDFYDKDSNLETEPVQGSNISMDITETDTDHAEADDIDTESEDDRQTVVEVDDEIDEDVFDYERPEEQSNEQSECEEAEREIDRYANRNASDWNDEGAIGGFLLLSDKSEDESITIDQMYNDAVKNTEESGIEKDYDTIVEEMNEEERNSTENKDLTFVSTEDILDKILREDETRNSHKSQRRDKIEATSKFINHEVSREVLNKSSTTSTTTSSTRLRSRYGYGPAILHRNYDDLDDLNVDINYKPKKEYKWRKNFRLDDDEPSEAAETSKNQNIECTSNADLNLDELDDSQANEEVRNGEVSSRSEENKSLQSSNHFDDLTEEINEVVIDSGTSKGAVKKQKQVRDEILNNVDESIPEREELILSKSDENEKALRKKKTKRKSRRGSKASLGNDEGEKLIPSPQNDENKEPDSESLSKKKPKRKKKILEAVSPPTAARISSTFVKDTLKLTQSADSSEANLKSPSPPRQDALINTTNFESHTKSLSPSPAKSPPPALNFKTPNSQPLEKLPEASKTSVHLTATSDVGESNSKSKSSSPKPATSNGSTSTRPATSPRPQLERNDSSGVYELIKDGSMYPWF